MRPLQNITGGTAGLEAFDPMKTRIITAVVLVPLLFITIWLLPEVFTAVAVGLISAAGAFELLHVTHLVRHPRMVLYAAVMSFLVPMWCWNGMDYAVGLLGALAYFCILFAEMMYDHIKMSFEKVAMTFVAGLVMPLMLSGIVRILMTRLGRLVILVPFLMAFMSDSGAYFVGKFFGRYKLAPVISPNKTIEGFVGGIFAGIISMVVYGLILQLGFGRSVNYIYAVVYGLVGALGATFGDLCFSVVKRHTGIKDYGSIFPGHGGILDRFDSVMVVAPLAEALLILIPFVR